MSNKGKQQQPRQYRQFDDDTKKLREITLQGLTNEYIASKEDSKNGRAEYGLVKRLIERCKQKVLALDITQDDINNTSKQRTKKIKKRAA